MLSETKELTQSLIQKVQLLDFVLQSLNANHKDYADRIEEQYKTASNHKLKLTEEILRVAGAEKVGSTTPAPLV